MANAIAHERGARHGPVGIASGSFGLREAHVRHEQRGKLFGAQIAAAGRVSARPA